MHLYKTEKNNLIKATMPAVRRAPAIQIPNLRVDTVQIPKHHVLSTTTRQPHLTAAHLWDIMRHGRCVASATQRPCLAQQYTKTRGTVHVKVLNAAAWLVTRVPPTI